jgi:hypothetical protein
MVPSFLCSVEAFAPAVVLNKAHKIAPLTQDRKRSIVSMAAAASSDDVNERKKKAKRLIATKNIPLGSSLSPRFLIPRKRNNERLFFYLKLLRDNTPAQAMNIGDKIHFIKEKDVKDTLFYQTKPSLVTDVLISGLYVAFKRAPEL